MSAHDQDVGPGSGETPAVEPFTFHQYMDRLQRPDTELTPEQTLDYLLGAVRECWNTQVNVRILLDVLGAAVVGKEAWDSIVTAVLESEDEFHLDESGERQDASAEVPNIKIRQTIKSLGHGNQDLPILLAKIMELTEAQVKHRFKPV